MDILNYPDKSLKTVCKRVTREDLTKVGVDVQALIEVMLLNKYHNEKVGEIKGVGAAANQIGSDLQVFIMSPESDLNKVDVFINPFIARHGKMILDAPEMCLSCPGLVKLIPRWKIIEVGYMTEQWEPVDRKFNANEARIFQHELDHLRGIVCMYKEGQPKCDCEGCEICN